MSAQFAQTCAVASQSYLQPRTYLPGVSWLGRMTESTTATAPQGEGWLPEQRPGLSASLQGGGKLGSGVSSQEVQSLPGVPGQGEHPEPARQFPLRHRGGRGFIAHIEPAGRVPSVMKVPLMASLVPLFHWRACLLTSNLSGFLWKHSSLSSS